MSSSQDQDGIPEGWEMYSTPGSDVVFYINKNAKKCPWPRPNAPAPSHDGYPLPEEIRCSHILLKHVESRRPVSWRMDSVKRSKADALTMIKDFRAQIMNKEAKFEDIAKVFSDCSSARRHGDLGRFKKGQMQRSFEKVAFMLKIGQMSKPVETRSGVHLILRTA